MCRYLLIATDAHARFDISKPELNNYVQHQTEERSGVARLQCQWLLVWPTSSKRRSALHLFTIWYCNSHNIELRYM